MNLQRADARRQIDNAFAIGLAQRFHQGVRAEAKRKIERWLAELY